MAIRGKQARASEQTDQPARRITKKDQILSLYAAGITDIEDLAVITHTRPSYVASVLQEAEQLSGYFDLYTTSSRRMNVYSKFFAGKLGYKDEEAAQHSIDLIDHFYRQFELASDRAGQHHALAMALTMFDRARWSGKEREADIFRRWLLDRLSREEPQTPLQANPVRETLPFRQERRRERASSRPNDRLRG